MNDYLIEQNGKVIECGTMTHEQMCRTMFKTSLDKHLKDKRAVRVKLHHEEADIESYDILTDIQRSRVNSILCKNNAYVLVTFIRGVSNVKTSDVRPIRSL